MKISGLFACISAKMASLEKNPLKNGNPVSAAVPTAKVRHVVGIRPRKPPIFQMSCSWCIAWMTEPAPRNSSALKKAWVKRWKMPAP